jgi:sterol desaturase/sphingolipid hydroxylase (fatty acid hydroxylase superfamily)
MFDNDFLEACSHIHPMTIPIVWVPVTIALSYLAVVSRGLDTISFVGLFLVGVLLWTFAEYMLHRYVFHYEPKSNWGKRFHFILHGVHHDYPNDATRLVMPLGISVPIAVIFFFLFTSIFGQQYAPAILAGFILGYICYDMIHYATHHLSMRGPVGAWLKKHHLRHHYGDEGIGYGVSSPLWDIIFGTLHANHHEEHAHNVEQVVNAD